MGSRGVRVGPVELGIGASDGRDSLKVAGSWCGSRGGGGGVAGAGLWAGIDVVVGQVSSAYQPKSM